MYLRFGKRLLDITLAALLIILLSPVMVWVALQIRKEDGGPVLFRHPRISRGRAFHCLKFRTMRTDADETLRRWEAEQTSEWLEFQKQRKLRDDPRVLPVGRFLRKSSLDELPQLFNVLLGDMSLVGPRPVTLQELELYAEYGGEGAYLRTRPGLTGLWQVSGRSNTTYAARVHYDQMYQQRKGLLMDLWLLILTLRVPFRQNEAC